MKSQTKLSKTLKLSRETLRRLDDTALARVAGGRPHSRINNEICPSETNSKNCQDTEDCP